MTRKEKKLASKKAMIKAVNRQIARLYHNASLPHPQWTAQNEYEEDMSEVWLQNWVENEVEAFDVEQLEPLTMSVGLTWKELLALHLNRQEWWHYATYYFGDSMTWGRGGRTFAPEGLVYQGQDWTLRFLDDKGSLNGYDTYTREELYILEQVLYSFNEYVRSRCKWVWHDYLDYKESYPSYQKEIDAHDDKVRRIVQETVYV